MNVPLLNFFHNVSQYVSSESIICAKVIFSKGHPYSISILVLLKLNYLIHLFARDVLVVKELEIKKTKPTFIISVLKVEYWVLVSLISNFFTNKTSLANKRMSFSGSNLALSC